MARTSRWTLSLALCLSASVAFAQNLPGEESAALAALRSAEDESDAHAALPNTVAHAAQQDGTTLGADTLPADFAARLAMPDIPMRMTPRLARTLAMFRTDARARRLLTSWVRKSNRYRHRIQQTLLRESVPASLVWVAGAESAFDPRAESGVGAAGLWQFMPDAGRSYGLRVDTWVDERRDPDRATLAGARYLRDLHTRFGTWELAFAAYNMGYNALLRAMRKYNTNDFETLASMEAGLPLETIHYVPRILSFAIASVNLAAFDLAAQRPDPVVAWDDVELNASVSLGELAREASVTEIELRALNPALLRSRTPPCSAGSSFTLHVPRGSSAALRAALARPHGDGVRAYAVRQGETVDEIAARWGLRASQLLAQSGLNDALNIRPGTVLLTPDRDVTRPAIDARPVVAVDTAVEAGTTGSRVFLRVTYADDATAIARSLGITVPDLLRWNHLDSHARLQPGMWVQAWVDTSRSAAWVWREDELEVVHRGSEAFHDRAVADTGQVRIRISVHDGDTLESLARRYHTTPGRIARINHLERSATLPAGTALIVYAAPEHVAEASAHAAPPASTETTPSAPTSTDTAPISPSSAPASAPASTPPADAP